MVSKAFMMLLHSWDMRLHRENGFSSMKKHRQCPHFLFLAAGSGHAAIAAAASMTAAVLMF